MCQIHSPGGEMQSNALVYGTHKYNEDTSSTETKTLHFSGRF